MGPFALLASAALDRLLHHSEVVLLEGDTYRNPRGKHERPTRSAEAAEAVEGMAQ
ncbi:MAG: ATP-binding protein [Planctomycetota bacterium]